MNTEKIPTEEFTFIIPQNKVEESEEITEIEVPREKTDPLYGLSFCYPHNGIVTSEIMRERIKEFLEYNEETSFSMLEIFAKVCKGNHSSSFKPFKDIVLLMEENGVILSEQTEYCKKYMIAFINEGALQEINEREVIKEQYVHWLPKRWRK